MNISKIQQPCEYQAKKILHNLQDQLYYTDCNNSSAAMKKLSRDLYVAGRTCKNINMEDFLNKWVINLANTLTEIKQYNLASVLYHFLINYNQGNKTFLETIILKAMKLRENEGGDTHNISELNKFHITCKENNIYSSTYQKVLEAKINALVNICKNNDTNNSSDFSTTLLQESKDNYLANLIHTRLDFAVELQDQDPKKAHEELLTAYNDISHLSHDYVESHKLSINSIKKYINIHHTKLFLGEKTKFEDLEEQFAYTSRKIIENTSAKRPIENTIFMEYYTNLYDKFREASLEKNFIDKSLVLANELKEYGNRILTNKIYSILLEKNIDNPANYIAIAKNGLKNSIQTADNLGILHFCASLQKIYREKDMATPKNCLDIIDIKIKTLKKIIENYDAISKHTNIRSKDSYIHSLIYDSVDAAKYKKKIHPEEAIKELEIAFRKLEQLSPEYLQQNDEQVKKQKEHIICLIDSIENQQEVNRYR